MTRLLIILLFCFLTIPQLAFAKDPEVVVSIRPIHSLVSNLMTGITEPKLLIDNGGSPHGNSLRPSQARMLSKADLIIWIGPELESFLVKPLATVAGKTAQLPLATRLESELLPVQQGGDWEKNGHAEHDEHGDDDHDDEPLSALDQHLWLSPKLAIRIAEESAASLTRIDPAHAVLYQKNLQLLSDRLSQLDAQLQERLAPVRTTPYIVFHAAYQYFEKAYNLNAVGSITIDPERKPGAKRLVEMRAKIEQLHTGCIFSEPQFESKLVATLTEGTKVRSGVLDPLGVNLEAGPDQYFQLLNQLADNLVQGLKP